MLLKKLLIIGIVGILSYHSAGDTYYVKKSGNDSSNGQSLESAWYSVSHALNRVRPGDIVYIGAGFYNERISPQRDGRYDSPIQIIADITGENTGDVGEVIITNDGSYVLNMDKDDYIQFRDITFVGARNTVIMKNCRGGVIENCKIHSSAGTGISILSSEITVEGSQIYDCNESALSIVGNAKATVRNCVIRGNQRYGIEVGKNAEITRIEECRINNNESVGIYIKDGSTIILNSLIYDNTGGGIKVAGSPETRLRMWNCTVTHNGRDGIELNRGYGEIRNSIITYNEDDGIDCNNGNIVSELNLLYENANQNEEGEIQAAGHIYDNPRFIADRQYRLSFLSPAIDVGLDSSSHTTRDLVGNSRPADSGWDLGCFEGGAEKLFTDVSKDTRFSVHPTKSTGAGDSTIHWVDLDDDGDLDVILAGSSARVLLSNDAGQQYFLIPGGNIQGGHGAVADFDNDGDIEYCGGVDFLSGGVVLYSNNGSGVMGNGVTIQTRDNLQSGITVSADTNHDGLCDVITFANNGNWIGRNGGGKTLIKKSVNDTEYGLNYTGDYGDGAYCSTGDINNDGMIDICYKLDNYKLFLSNGDATYSMIELADGESDNSKKKTGTAWADYDNDGDLDIFLPNPYKNAAGTLLRNDGSSFANVTVIAGLTDTSEQRSTCWGDYDNDGDLDIFITTINANDLLYENQGDGTFILAQVGIEMNGDTDDAVFVDYDNDGDLDLSITQPDQGSRLLRNDNDGKDYLKVRVIGAGAGGTNRAGIGVKVLLYEAESHKLLARRDVGIARGLGGTAPLWVHFGGITNSEKYVVEVHFVTGVMSVTVIPQDVSTTIQSHVIEQMVTVTETSVIPMKMVKWQEIPPGY